MRVMVFVKANEASERGVMPSTQLLEDMTAYNEELVKAGIMLAGEGLHPSSNGARVVFDGNKAPVVVDGPFAETKEVLGGFYIVEAGDLDGAIEIARMIPFGRDGAVEIRPLLDEDG